jgi:glycosyltransferase involved in cell wall biosynthesis
MSTLSILIPTLPEADRVASLARLLAILKPQIKPGKVEVIVNKAPREYDLKTGDRIRGGMSTGEKRNLLYAQARGKYAVSLDDDDWVPDYYVREILDAALEDPDVITFNGWMTTDQKPETRVDFILRLGEKYEARMVNGKEVYFRFPNHIVPMKTELIRGFKFEHKTKGEDYPWALAIHESGIFKKEVYINRDMYHYDWTSVKP